MYFHSSQRLPCLCFEHQPLERSVSVFPATMKMTLVLFGNYRTYATPGSHTQKNDCSWLHSC